MQQDGVFTIMSINFLVIGDVELYIRHWKLLIGKIFPHLIDVLLRERPRILLQLKPALQNNITLAPVVSTPNQPPRLRSRVLPGRLIKWSLMCRSPRMPFVAARPPRVTAT